ncbi:hypothetical protein ACJZ2D_012571 [Fusarium nematophilum]
MGQNQRPETKVVNQLCPLNGSARSKEPCPTNSTVLSMQPSTPNQAGNDSTGSISASTQPVRVSPMMDRFLSERDGPWTGLSRSNYPTAYGLANETTVTTLELARASL